MDAPQHHIRSYKSLEPLAKEIRQASEATDKIESLALEYVSVTIVAHRLNTKTTNTSTNNTIESEHMRSGEIGQLKRHNVIRLYTLTIAGSIDSIKKAVEYLQRITAIPELALEEDPRA